MSEIAKRPEGGDIARKPKLSLDQLNSILAAPLDQIPETWRPHVLNFWMQYQAVQGSEDAFAMLCARIRIWRSYGLKFTDLDHAFRTLMHPERTVGFRYGNDVVNSVGALVARHMERRAGQALLNKYEAEKLDPDAIHRALQQMITRQQEPRDDAAQSDSSPSVAKPDADQAKPGPTSGPGRKSRGRK